MTTRKRRRPHAAPGGMLIRATGKDGPQLMRSKGKRWTDAAETIFLDRLAASCNVTLSAEAAGFSTEAIYRRRRHDPAFAQRWQVALEQGYARIEIMLVEAATTALAGLSLDPESPIPRMTVKEAMGMLQLYRAHVKGGDARYPGWQARPRSLDEMRDSILTKLEAIEATRGEALPEAVSEPISEPVPPAAAVQRRRAPADPCGSARTPTRPPDPA